jgi:ATP-dependent DNA helicase RecQ
VTAGFVELSAGDRPVVELTSAGRAVMKGERPPRMALPSERAPGLSSRPPSGRPSAGARAADPALSNEELSLFERLRQVRLELAREDAVPPFVVASDRALRDVARLRPRTATELVRAYGIGPAKAERYGARFLAVIGEA